MIITDPWFYIVAFPAIILFGISKGGFGGGLGVMAVPLMALAISPVEAAAIMLPVLCFMDLFGIWAYKNQWDPVNLRMLVPGCIIGIIIGTLLFRFMSPAFFKLLLGSISILFTLDYWSKLWRQKEYKTAQPNFIWGSIAGIVAGFTSFVAHAGAPPISMYLLPQRMHRTLFVATTVLLFTIINYVKLIPYGWLGLLHVSNLATSLILLPIAVLSFLFGIWLHKKVTDTVFYQICYVLLFVVGVKLIFDGISSYILQFSEI